MTAELIVGGLLWVALNAAIGIACWRCARWATGFLLLGATVVLWPVFYGFGERVLMATVQQMATGSPPSIFPFSIIAAESVSLGYLVTRFHHVMQLVRYVLYAVSFVLIARSFPRRRPASHPEPHRGMAGRPGHPPEHRAG